MRRRRGSFRRKAATTAVCLLLLAAGAAVPSLAERYLRLKIHADLVDVSLPGMQDSAARGGFLEGIVGLGQTLVGDAPVILHLEVHNDCPLSFTVVSASYRLDVDNREAATGVWRPAPSPMTVLPQEELSIELPVRPDAAGALVLSAAVLQGHQPALRAHGTLGIKVLGATLSLPFEVSKVGINFPPPAAEEPSPTSVTGDDTGLPV